MRVKSVIKLFKESQVHICDQYGGLLCSVEVDESGEVYALASLGFSYTQYSLFENSKVEKISAPYGDIIIQVRG